MNKQLLGLHGLGLILTLRTALFLFGCDESPSFVVDEATLEKDKVEQSLDADRNPAEGDPFAGGDKDPIIIKDDGGDETIPDKIEENEEELTLASMESDHKASEVLDGETNFSIDELLHESRYNMTSRVIETNQGFTQITRPRLMQQFKQGADGNAFTDNYMQDGTMGVLDVLVVIDNSGSMNEEQVNLASKLEPLLSEIETADWQIGVVTTDDDCLRDIIKKGDANVEADFAAAINAGTNGSGNERGIKFAVEGLNMGCQTTPWIRQKSTVAVLIVSDEDNCSNDGAGCPGEDWNVETYLSDYLATIRVPGVSARVYGIFWHPNDAQATCPTGAYQATQYSRLVAATNGTWGSICDADYSNTLSQISKDISVILDAQFMLTHTPDPGTVKVYVEGNLITTGYSVAGNVISFTEIPPEGSKIKVDYAYGATPINKAFALTNPAVADQIEVKVNGSTVLAKNYSYDSPSRTIEFADYPAQNADIEVNFTKDVPLNKDFTIAGEVKAGTVSVKVNGKKVDPAGVSFDENNNVVSLSAAPYDAADIKVYFQKYGNPILAYPYQMAENQTNVAVKDLDSGDELGFSYDGQFINIDETDFARGRKFAAIDPDASGVTNYNIVLPVEPVTETVIVSFETGECRPPGSVTIKGSTINLENCAFGSSIDDGKITYDYTSVVKEEIELDREFFEQEHQAQIWRVWIDDTLTTDYEVDGHIVRFTKPLDPSNTISIKVSLVKAI